jgi:hypothetical protein
MATEFVHCNYSPASVGAAEHANAAFGGVLLITNGISGAFL